MTDKYVPVSDPQKADALLVRSADLHEAQFAPELKAIARAGAGVNNIPWSGAPRRESSSSTRREPTPTA